MKLTHFSERLIWFQCLFIYPIYLSGSLFLWNIIQLWILVGYVIFCQIKIYFEPENQKISHEIRSWRSAPSVLWGWLISMVMMGILILVGLYENGYNSNELLRSSLGWLGDWALLGFYPVLGYLLPIRPTVIYRSACVIAAQSLVVIPICYGAYLLKLPGLIYLSPLERIIQNGAIYYAISWYTREVDSDGIRLILFTPWGPALGLMGCLFFFYTVQEDQLIWKGLGIIGSLAMLLTSVSRGAYLFLPMTIVIVWVIKNLSWIQFELSLGVSCFIGGLGSTLLLDRFQDFLGGVKSARKSSSQLRAELERVALDRWMDSPLFGHGKQTPGPDFLKHMPIGSHHTWIGLLFTQGLTGLFLFLIPLVWSLIGLSLKIKSNPVAGVAFSGLLLITFSSFSDNIEKMAYLYWSTFLLIGIAYRRTSSVDHLHQQAVLTLGESVQEMR
jgi:hypothetical protein